MMLTLDTILVMSLAPKSKRVHDYNSFSTIHCNIRSLNANFDNLRTMLSNIDFSFNIIGLTETKIKFGQDILLNHVLDGYEFFIFILF